MVTVTQMKCACESCLCIVDLNSAIQKEGKSYCSQACADGHPQGVKAVAMGAVLVTNRAINRKKLSQIYKLKQYPSPKLGIFFDKD